MNRWERAGRVIVGAVLVCLGVFVAAAVGIVTVPATYLEAHKVLWPVVTLAGLITAAILIVGGLLIASGTGDNS